MTVRFIELYDAMIRCGVHFLEFEIDTESNPCVDFDKKVNFGKNGPTIRESLDRFFKEQIVKNIEIKKNIIIIKSDSLDIEIPNELLPESFLVKITHNKSLWRFGNVCEINFKLKKRNNYIKHLLAYAERLNNIEKKKQSKINFLFSWHTY